MNEWMIEEMKINENERMNAKMNLTDDTFI